MVASVAQHGYDGQSIAAICHTAGVSPAAFYRFFGCREDCFLAIVDELRALGMARVHAGHRRARDWRSRIRAALEELLALLAEQPAAAHVYVVNVYEAPAGRERVRAGLAEFEELLARGFAASPSHAALPREIVAALVAGVQMTIHQRLVRGEVEGLPSLGPPLADWVLSYASPPQPLPALDLPAGRHSPTAAAAERDMQERLLRAVAEVCADEGVSSLTTQAMAKRARTSLRSVYQRFPSGAEEAFLFVLEEIVGRCVAVSQAAYAKYRDWPAQMGAVNRELFGYLAAEPSFATTVLVEVLGAGPNALALRDRVLAPFGDLLRGGEALRPEVPALVREAIVFAVYSLVGREIAERGPAGVPALVPVATYMELAPYLGAAGAAREAASLARGGA